MPLLTLFIALILLLPGHAAAAEVYRWQDTEGNHHYGDRPSRNAVNPHLVELKLAPPLYEVEKVLDGDTIILHGGDRVRLLGINAPEIAHRKNRAEPFGNEAHQRLEQLLQGKRVTLDFDLQRRDRFKRLLAYVTREDGTRVSELLLREGLARTLFLQPNMKRLRRYHRAEAEAIAAGRGIWSLPEFAIRPASQAEACIKSFCRLRGRVEKVERKRDYSYLTLQGGLRLAIANKLLPQFEAEGIVIPELKGEEVVVRGWVGRRDGGGYLKLHHPLQIKRTTTP